MQQISTFNDVPVSNTNSVILSASRMTDMPKYYPNEIINQVKNRLNKGVEKKLGKKLINYRFKKRYIGGVKLNKEV